MLGGCFLVQPDAGGVAQSKAPIREPRTVAACEYTVPGEHLQPGDMPAGCTENRKTTGAMQQEVEESTAVCGK